MFKKNNWQSARVQEKSNFFSVNAFQIQSKSQVKVSFTFIWFSFKNPQIIYLYGPDLNQIINAIDHRGSGVLIKPKVKKLQKFLK